MKSALWFQWIIWYCAGWLEWVRFYLLVFCCRKCCEIKHYWCEFKISL